MSNTTSPVTLVVALPHGLPAVARDSGKTVRIAFGSTVTLCGGVWLVATKIVANVGSKTVTRERKIITTTTMQDAIRKGWVREVAPVSSVDRTV